MKNRSDSNTQNTKLIGVPYREAIKNHNMGSTISHQIKKPPLPKFTPKATSSIKLDDETFKPS
jgi:hypothetical protein